MFVLFVSTFISSFITNCIHSGYIWKLITKNDVKQTKRNVQKFLSPINVKLSSSVSKLAVCQTNEHENKTKPKSGSKLAILLYSKNRSYLIENTNKLWRNSVGFDPLMIKRTAKYFPTRKITKTKTNNLRPFNLRIKTI